MSINRGPTHTFRCPECGDSLEVNDAMKEALIDRGCVICGATVTAKAFTRISSLDST